MLSGNTCAVDINEANCASRNLTPAGETSDVECPNDIDSAVYPSIFKTASTRVKICRGIDALPSARVDDWTKCQSRWAAGEASSTTYSLWST
jgi:hypothetical protein